MLTDVQSKATRAGGWIKAGTRRFTFRLKSLFEVVLSNCDGIIVAGDGSFIVCSSPPPLRQREIRGSGAVERVADERLLSDGDGTVASSGLGSPRDF